MGGKNQPKELTKTTTQTANIPSFLQPFVQGSAGAGAGAIGSLQAQLSPGTSLVSGFNPDQRSAFDLARGAVTDPNGAFLTAQDALGQTAGGNFLFGSPGFDEAVAAATRAAQPGILSRFGAAGRGTGGLAQAAIAQASSDAFSRLFNQERGRQLQAAQLLPQIAQSGIGLLSNIGGAQQQQAERELRGPIDAQRLLLQSALGGLPVSSLLGRTQQFSQPLFENRTAGALGGAATGAQLGLKLGGPFGAAIGGIGGGLLGGFA